MMSKLNLFLAVFIINISYGQGKVNKLISAYARDGKFKGSVLVAEKGVGLADMEWNVPRTIEYLSKERTIKSELAESNDKGYRYKVLPVRGEDEG